MNSDLGHDQGGEESSTLCFQDGITNLLMETEELRSKLNTIESVTNDDIFQILQDLEDLLARLYSPPLNIEVNSKNRSDEIGIELRKNCVQKSANVAIQSLRLIANKSGNKQGKEEPDPEDDNYQADEERDVQSAIARIAELNLALICDGDLEGKQEKTRQNIEEIVNMYASYQKKVLRQRARPSIARLVEYRKRREQMAGITNGNEEEEDGDPSSSSRSHVQVLTTILGQATALIHPLMVWKSNLPPRSALFKLCARSIHTLDEQAESLAKTVASWFMEDSQIDNYWMLQMSGGENNQTDYSSSDRITDIDLGDLDNVVDRLAFCCQIFDRYIQLVVVEENENHNSDDVPTTILKDMHPEWTWKYASLERYLTMQQLRSALHPTNNFPVEIIVGASVRVPSVVEDAQYLSTRALKRAASTRSDQAIGTVAHSIASDVWSTDSGGNGIHEALVEQRGCTKDLRNGELSSVARNDQMNRNANAKEVIDSPPKSNNNSNSFAQALLGALDDDPVPTNSAVASPNSGSGGLLSSLTSSVVGGDKFLQIRLDTHVCALNGTHSAAAACSSLVEFLDSLLLSDNDNDNNDDEVELQQPAQSSMVHLAREELFRYSRNYQDLLKSQAVRLVAEFCGSLHDAPVYNSNMIIPVLRYYLERESYDLPDAHHLARAEEETRLYKMLIQPLKECKLLQQFEKCDSGVLRVICEEMARVVAELFLDVILSPSIPKRFTDWGSLLFSKEVRLVQNYLQALMQQAASTAAALHQNQASAVPLLTSQFERLLQAVTILQLEKPSDWTSYYQATSVFQPQELRALLSLRVDFSSDVIERAVSSAAADSAIN